MSGKSVILKTELKSARTSIHHMRDLVSDCGDRLHFKQIHRFGILVERRKWIDIGQDPRRYDDQLKEISKEILMLHRRHNSMHNAISALQDREIQLIKELLALKQK